MGDCCCGGWDSAFVKPKWSPYFSIYQGGCGEASVWKSVPLDAGTVLS
jgi:hypothetical protein